MKSAKSSNAASLTVQLPKSLQLKHPVSVLPVSQLSTLMYLSFSQKKAQSVNLDGEMYTTKVESFTHKKVYDVILSKKFLGPEDHVLLIDDFLANGCALLGLIDIVKKSGATLEGAGIVIEKGFQHGGQQIRDMGIRLESLAIIDSMSDDSLTFRE